MEKIKEIDTEQMLKLIMDKLGCTRDEAIQDAIRHYAEYVRDLEVVEYRDISVEQAKKEIIQYIKGKEKVDSDDIANDLKIDMSIVNEVMIELWKEGWVEQYD